MTAGLFPQQKFGFTVEFFVLIRFRRFRRFLMMRLELHTVIDVITPRATTTHHNETSTPYFFDSEAMAAVTRRAQLLGQLAAWLLACHFEVIFRNLHIHHEKSHGVITIVGPLMH